MPGDLVVNWMDGIKKRREFSNDHPNRMPRERMIVIGNIVFFSTKKSLIRSNGLEEFLM